MYKKLVAIFFSGVMLLYGCGDLPQKQTTHLQRDDRSASFYSFYNPMVEDQQPSSNEEQNEGVAFLFLVDESGSVIGSPDAGDKRCQPIEPIHKQNLSVLIDILKDLPKKQTQNIHVGISSFGREYKEIIPLSPVPNLNKEKIDDYLRNTNSNEDQETRFATALEKAYSTLNDYSSRFKLDKVLVVLTDGFGVDHNKGEMETKLFGIDFSTKIVVSLVCPDDLKKSSYNDYAFWGMHRIPQANFPLGFFNTVFTSVGVSNWDDPYGIIDHDRMDVSVPGDAYLFQWHFYPFVGSSGDSVRLFRKTEDTNNDKYYYSNEGPIPMKPNSECKKLDLSLNADSDLGFWMVQSSPLRLSLPTIDSATDIINFAPSEISVKIKPTPESQLERDDFQKWAGCYPDIGFEYTYDPKGFDKSGGIQYPNLQPIPCINSDGFLCADIQENNTLIAAWNWNLARDLSKDKVYLRPYVITSQDGKIIGQSKELDLKYKPTLAENMIYASVPILPDYVSRIPITTLYNHTTPKFFLVQTGAMLSGIDCPPGGSVEIGNQNGYKLLSSQKKDSRFFQSIPSPIRR